MDCQCNGAGVPICVASLPHTEAFCRSCTQSSSNLCCIAWTQFLRTAHLSTSDWHHRGRRSLR